MHVTAHIWLAIDGKGNWVARGSGSTDEHARRDEELPPGTYLSYDLGDDDSSIECVEVCVEVPIPQAKVLTGMLFAKE